MNLEDPVIDALHPLLRRLRTDKTAKRVKVGSVWTNEPLTRTLIAQHINGGPARGCCPIQAGESVTMTAWADLDSHKGETPWPEMVRVATLLIEACERHGLLAIAFRSSGGRGIHLIFMWETPQDAYSVRMLLRAILAEIGFTDGAGGVAARQIEIFPKQDSVGEDGHGNMVILPLAGQSVPLEPLLDLQPMDKDYALQIEWVESKPVPVLQRPERAAGEGESVDIEVLRSALAAIPNGDDLATDDPGLPYEAWRDIVFAIHHATGGSDEGLELARQFSARSPKWDGGAWLERRTWPYIRSDRDSLITARTILRMAQDIGWNDPSEVFEDLDAADAAERAAAQAQADEDDLTGLGAAGLAALGLVVVPPVIDTSPPAGLQRNGRGEILATISNVQLAVSQFGFSGMQLGFDEFRDEIVWTEPGQVAWRPFGDKDYTSLRLTLERRGFKAIGREMVRDVVQWVAEQHRFDTAIEWLRGLKWDGVPRVGTFYSRYFLTDDTPYTRAASRYTWTAMAGRVLSPGCKADMVPILIGPQGKGKTTGVTAMVPDPQHFTEVSFGENENDLARKMRGTLVAEIGELRGLHTRELESIKAFITRTHEKWTPKYREFAVTFPRRLIFIGTTNQTEFLSDETGHRRMLPLMVGKVDVEALRSDCEQLWAEAREMYGQGGIAFADAEALAPAMHEQHVMRDTWEEPVTRWLLQMDPMTGKTHADADYLQISTVLKEAVGVESRSMGRREEMRMSGVLQKLGYRPVRTYIDGRQVRVYVTTKTTLGQPLEG